MLGSFLSADSGRIYSDFMSQQAQTINPRVKFWTRTASIMGLAPGFVILSSLMAQLTGEGWPLAMTSTGALILLPFGIFRYLLRHHRRPWLSSMVLLGLFHWALLLTAILASPSSTMLALRRHGAWPASLVAVKKRAAIQEKVASAVDMLPGAPAEVPYTFRGGAIIVQASFRMGDTVVKAPMILDTGATITAVSPKILEKLGVTPDPRAPVFTFETAGGQASYPLVMLDEISMGGRSVSPVVAAVCQQCETGDAYGLIGLNFASHYRIQIDQRAGKLVMEPRSGWVDRSAEVEPFLELVPDITADSFEARLVNMAPRGISDLVLSVTFLASDGRALREDRVTLKTLPPRGQTALRLDLPQGTDGVRWEVSRAQWIEKDTLPDARNAPLEISQKINDIK